MNKLNIQRLDFKSTRESDRFQTLNKFYKFLITILYNNLGHYSFQRNTQANIISLLK